MERLHKLLHSLDQMQVKVLKKYLTSFSTRDPNTKFWELARILLADKENYPDQKKCSMLIYNSKPDGRIERLKNRLYEKVLDSLLIDININRDVYADEVHPIQVRVRKKMILYELLKFTPMRNTVGMEMISDIISTAKQYEFYPILLDAMYIRKWNVGMKKGIDFLKKMNEEISQVEKSKQYSQRATDLYSELGQISTFNSKADHSKMEKFLVESIAELKGYYLETEVKSVWHFLKTFEMSLCQLNKDYSGAKEIAVDMIAYMKENRTVGRKVRFGIWNMYITEFELQLGNYSGAIQHIVTAREYFQDNSMNYAITRKFEIDAYFLKEEYEKTKGLIDEYLETSSIVAGDFRRDMMLYYKGCCHFNLGEYREAARLFNLKFELTRDKLGWEVNIRIMRILTMLELDKPDEAHAMVETITKHIERYKQTKDLTDRDQMLLKLFRELAKEGFGFHTPTEKVYHILLQLQESGKPHSWEALTPELIPIHKWVIKKYGRIVAPADFREKEQVGFKTAARKKAKGNA